MSSGEPIGPVVTIGLKEIYDQTVSLNTKVEVLMGDHADAKTLLTDHESRLRSLERGRWPLPALTILIALASLGLAAVALFTR